ncbi:inverted formin-2-like [Helianthus annuus]|uniref:inverted formin-2-like n=1 Tax=Helianthus annuus TaxID=4232 RepID=UPI0016530FB2|nr:inverted formin-2-like [Helianthus annuus]
MTLSPTTYVARTQHVAKEMLLDFWSISKSKPLIVNNLVGIKIHPKSHNCSGDSCSQSDLNPPLPVDFLITSTPDSGASNPSDLYPPPSLPSSGSSSNLAPPPPVPSLAPPSELSSGNQTPPPPSPVSVATPPPPVVVVALPPELSNG